MKRVKRAESQAPLPCYPRPQMVREAWISLDGEWRFSFDDRDAGEREKWFSCSEDADAKSSRTICVPYSYETEKSGISDGQVHPVVWYWRTVTIPGCTDQESSGEAGKKRRYLLHFDGCDYRTKVWINGSYIGSHTGGYARFTFDVGRLQAGDTLNICVRAEDRLSEEQMRGKQRWLAENYGCWYVQTTGIWKSVWMEPVGDSGEVCDAYIQYIKTTPDIHRKELELEADITGWRVQAQSGQPQDEKRQGMSHLSAQCTVSYQGAVISRTTVPVQQGRISARLPVYDTAAGEWGIALWSPDSPHLYDLEIVLICGGTSVDRVTSYFGMREIRTEGANVLLNGQPLFQKLILYQGYRTDSGLTNCRDEDILDDIGKIREMGFNGLRIHQKTESERFLYWCDVKGLLVWAEAPSFYRFSDRAAADFAREWEEIVRQHYNHPSIITWTPLNESWGVPDIKTDRRQQDFSRMVYYMTKMFDPVRPVIGNDGWEHTESDIITLHDYEEDGVQMQKKYLNKMAEILSGKFYHNNYRSAFAEGFSYHGQPVIISECGGAAFAEKGEKDWGYGRSVKDGEEFLARFREVTVGIRGIPEVCGYCYTQFTDVQQEKNGLLTEDRRYKVSPELIRAVNEAPAGMFVNKKGY